MTEEQIMLAIERARAAISQYQDIMRLFPRVNVAHDAGFQRRFNALYKVRQRSREWYSEYYSFMESLKGSKPSFSYVLDHFFASMGRVEASFSSKLVATLDPNQPVWDSLVLGFIGQKAPAYASKDRIDKAKTVYRNVQEWYRQYMGTSEGKFVVSTFNRLVEGYGNITDLKKIDFVLWKTGPQ